MSRRWPVWAFVAAMGCSEDAEQNGPPPCGSHANTRKTLIASPGQSEFDADLDARARAYDRVYFAISTFATGLSADVSLAATSSNAEKQLVDAFAANDSGFDLESASGRSPADLFTYHKSTGLYAGAGIAADAYRYASLRDDGADCADVDHARTALLRAMDALAITADIDGVPGVNARSIIRTDLPNAAHEVPVPLFDEAGNPLPTEKNNGTWREDQTDRYSHYLWEDSISRDMLLGWAWAYGALWEVIREDDSIDEAKKARLRKDAQDTVRALMKVGTSGYDLEIPDADGRLTFHAYLNENVLDRLYVPGVANGFHAVMALGIVGAFAYAAEDASMTQYLESTLVHDRKLARIASDDMLVVNMGIQSNFSNFNMAFTAMLLAQRYVASREAEPFLLDALERELWTKPEAGPERQPKDMHQSLFDLIYAAGKSGASAHGAGTSADASAVESAMTTLRDYPQAPVWDVAVRNCDDAEIASGNCTLDDGTQVKVLGEVGRNDGLVADQIIPMRVRPRSNYHWRSDPYRPNGDGSGRSLNPAVDWRAAYWFGRYVEVE